jgi:hypothetical protein
LWRPAAADTLGGDMRCQLVRETGPAYAPKPRLLDRVRAVIRARHYSRRTEDAYVAWIRRFILYHGKRHPAEMSAPEITRFLVLPRQVHRPGPATEVARDARPRRTQGDCMHHSLEPCATNRGIDLRASARRARLMFLCVRSIAG